MKLAIALPILTLAFVCGTTLVESIYPFWIRTTTPMPTLPPTSDRQFYDKFKQIPPITMTADKIVKKFFRLSSSVLNKRRIHLQDTAVVMDSSGSIGDCEYKKGKQAMKNLMNITLPPKYDGYWAGVQYSNDARIMFNFFPASKAATKSDLFFFENGWTNTAGGLAKAKDLFDDPTKGSRRGARQMVFLVTDGQSNIDKGQTVPNARRLKDDGVEIFVIGVGDFSSGIEEIVQIASLPVEDHVLRVRNYGNMIDVVKLVIKEINPGQYAIVEKIPPPC
ncbi:collagen alpha-1(XIV) chain-like [Xenia sp. Carnegie-2017]|uniref:collagen alpha-1(XIV) chain-like n=1 Tax=Xenia sp. Carnegie-2017 TaxID=2897299 RepID=UPI001F04F5E6|nr:collagen alpha-1(XIV) chain-like [Xenia sp. Carnegie-2017]